MKNFLDDIAEELESRGESVLAAKLDELVPDLDSRTSDENPHDPDLTHDFGGIKDDSAEIGDSDLEGWKDQWPEIGDYAPPEEVDPVVHTAALDKKISRQEKDRVNKALRKAGFDGNSRFRSVGAGLSAASKVLEQFGFEPDEIFSGYPYNMDQGSKSINLARSNPDDPFSPVSITNLDLRLSWTKLDNNRYELIGYLT